MASHQSAALILGLPTPGFGHREDRPVSLTLPATGDSTRSATVIHHTGPLLAGQVRRDKEGYLVTTPARTALDLAADLPLPEGLVLLDRAARLICTSPREPVSGVGRRVPVGGQHAAERLADTALPGRDPDPLGALYPDFLWEDLKLIGECDGAIKYNDASGYVLEKEREQVLRDLEYRFVRWLPKEIMLRPDVVMERIARALAC